MAIKVVVVGMGARGRDWVREVRAATGFELAGCVEIDNDVRQNAAAALTVSPETCFKDLREAIEKTGCQAVIVATPPDCHVEPCRIALSRKLAVLVEKPFTIELREAIQLVSLAEQQKAPLLVAQNYRYLRSFSTARQLIEIGTLGRIDLVNCQYYRPPHEMATSLATLPHGVLWGMAIHHLDTLRHMLGSEVTNVTAESFTCADGNIPPGRSLRALLTFANGTRGVYSATYESSGHQFFERGQEFYARFVGNRATLHIFQRWLILCENGKLPRWVRRGPRHVTEEQVLLRQLEAALLEGKEADVSGRDNLKTMAVVEACVRSTAEQRWIDPQLLLNEYG